VGHLLVGRQCGNPVSDQDAPAGRNASFSSRTRAEEAALIARLPISRLRLAQDQTAVEGQGGQRDAEAVLVLMRLAPPILV
jgi:hypothetical protein